VGVLAEVFQLTGDPAYAQAIRHTISFMEREMLSAEGGFYAALDADSEGVEGKFYTWTYAEARQVLGEDDFPLFADLWDISPEGNWEHVNILRLRQKPGIVAARHGLTEGELEQKMDQARGLLMGVRAARVRPQLDNKVLLGWNALMNAALSKAYAALGDEAYRELARKNMDFLLRVFRDPVTGGLFHTYTTGSARYPAFLDDYASLVDALICLQEITGDTQYLEEARRWTAYVLSNFSEETGPFFYFTPESQQDILVRKKEVYDGATPSGNAQMAWNLHRLSILVNEPSWALRSGQMLDALVEALTRYPQSFGLWANLLQEIVLGTNEIVILGPGAAAEASRLLREYLPNRVFQFSELARSGFPLLEGKVPGSGPTWFLCRNYACKRPVYSLEEMLQLLDKGQETKTDAVQ
jgi:uncharacterized protein YyaL (SSP411 family)